MTVLAPVLASAVLASSGTNSTSTVYDVEPGLLGFLVVAALGVALVFLLRSMNKHLKKLGPKPVEPEDTGAGSAAAEDAGPAAKKPLRGLALRAAMLAEAEADASKDQHQDHS